MVCTSWYTITSQLQCPEMTPLLGPQRLRNDLEALGFKAEVVKAPDGTGYVVIRSYMVPLGRFAGRVIDLGLLARPDFPQGIGSAIHVRATPQLFEYSDSVPNVRNIVESALGEEWRYWSVNFKWTGERSARRLMSQVNGVFERA